MRKMARMLSRAVIVFGKVAEVAGVVLILTSLCFIGPPWPGSGYLLAIGLIICGFSIGVALIWCGVTMCDQDGLPFWLGLYEEHGWRISIPSIFRATRIVHRHGITGVDQVDVANAIVRFIKRPDYRAVNTYEQIAWEAYCAHTKLNERHA